MMRVGFCSALSLLLFGCTDTHDYVGIWCGGVSWSWSYTYFDTLYEEPNFRVEDTCWRVARTRQALTGLETLQVSAGDVPDGWCHYYAPEGDRSLVPSSECGFIMQAQDQGGNVFDLEQFWRLESGAMTVSDISLEMDAQFRTATYFDGNEIWGEATAFYSGTRADGVEPLEPSGSLFQQRDTCAVDGCWLGAFAGNVVTGPPACENLLAEYSFDGVRFELTESGRSLTVNGEPVPTFPYLQSCEMVAKDAGQEDGDWTYRVNELGPGTVHLEVELSAPAPGGTLGESCELYWQANGGACPS